MPQRARFRCANSRMGEDAVRIQQQIQELLACCVQGFRHLAAAISDVQILRGLHRHTARLDRVLCQKPAVPPVAVHRCVIAR